jgi:4-hydroxy-4-methyl-2-oxoglutarate aldolase
MSIVVNERVEVTVPAELLERLRAIPPATVGHMWDFGFMRGDLRPRGKKGFVLCGPAFTVKTMAMDSAVVHVGIGMAEPGDVMVIDRNGDEKHSCWGEMTSLAAKVRGLAGTIVDGPATDIVEIDEMEYLVFAKGVAPITTRAQPVPVGEINTVIQCGGVSVSPGDIILADDNGILVIPQDKVAEVVERCEPRAKRESETRRRILAGEALADVSGAAKRVADALANKDT